MFAQVIRIATNAVGTIVLARLLSPDAFGLMAIALVVVGLAELIRDFGLSSAALHERELSHEQASNLFWLNAGMGVVVAATVAAIAPLVARLFHYVELRNMLLVLSSVFLWNALSTQFRVKINREYRFLALSLCDIAPAVIGLGLAIVMAYEGYSYWSLVGQIQATALIGLILAALLARWRPGPPSRKGAIGKLVRYGWHLLGTQAVTAAVKSVDTLALGATATANLVGQYNRAYSLIMVPLGQIQAPMTRVVLPTLSRAADDREVYLAYLRKAHLVYVYFSVTLFLVGAALGPALVTFLLGPGWHTAGIVFAVLALGGCFRSLVQVWYWTFLSLDLTRQQLRFTLVVYPLIGAFMVAGAAWGPVGVAIGHSVGFAGYWAVSLWWLMRLTGLHLGPLAKDFARVAACFSLPAAAAAAAVGLVVTSPPMAVLAGCIAAAVATFACICVNRRVRQEVRYSLAFVKSGFSKRGSTGTNGRQGN